MPYRDVEKERARGRRKYHNNKQYLQDLNLERRNGITREIYDEMLSEQNGKCLTCGAEPTSRRLAVDHDHGCCPDTRKACGKCTRALLCFRCNSTLGKFNDNPEMLRRLADYLEWFGGESDALPRITT